MDPLIRIQHQLPAAQLHREAILCMYKTTPEMRKQHAFLTHPPPIHPIPGIPGSVQGSTEHTTVCTRTPRVCSKRTFIQVDLIKAFVRGHLLTSTCLPMQVHGVVYRQWRQRQTEREGELEVVLADRLDFIRSFKPYERQ